jgi:hypothetical protein
MSSTVETKATRRDCGAEPRIVQVAAICPGGPQFGREHSDFLIPRTPRMPRGYGSRQRACSGATSEKSVSPLALSVTVRRTNLGSSTAIEEHTSADEGLNRKRYGHNAVLSYKRSGSLLGKDHMQNHPRCRSGLSGRKRRNGGALNAIRHAGRSYYLIALSTPPGRADLAFV